MKKLLKNLVLLVVLSLVLSTAYPVYATFNITGGGTYRLNSSIGVGNTTINLSSFKEPVSQIPYTMSYLQSDIGYGTLDPQNDARSEFVSFTGITQNSNGTAVLTGVTRGLTRTPAPGVTGCTASTTLRQAHTGQSVFILSDNPCLFTQYAVKQNNEAITGSWTIPTPTTAFNPATKGYVDSVVGGITTTDKITVAGTAGETFSTGNLVYVSTADARWYKVSASATSTMKDAIVGIAQGSGTAGNSISGGVLILGLDSNQTGLTVGANYFASTTAGEIGLATTSRGIGKARTSTTLYVDPSFAITGQSNLFTATTTFSATSSVVVGSFPIYQIGKNSLIATSTGSGTFTPPNGVTKVWFRLVGAGGGAYGTASGNAGSTGGGGGAGGYCSGVIDVSATTSIGYTIGTGGTGGTNNNSGSKGGTSNLSSYCYAFGGFGGSAEPGGGGLGATSTASVSGVLTQDGQDGGGGIDTGTVGISGKGGDSIFGQGGASLVGGSSALTGKNGVGFGGGASAGIGSAAGQSTGGTGAGGALWIWW